MEKIACEFFRQMLELHMPISVQPEFVLKKDESAGLVIIDMIKGFCEPGAGNLAPVEYDPVMERAVNEADMLARRFYERGYPILVLKDEHDPVRLEKPFLPHAVKGTSETHLMPQLQWLERYLSVTIMPKDCINGIIAGFNPESGQNAVLDWMNKHKVALLVVVGVCTDICVTQFVQGGLSVRQHEGMVPTLEEVIVYLPGIATYDLSVTTARLLNKEDIKAHPRDVTEYVSLYMMQRNGAILTENMIIME